MGVVLELLELLSAGAAAAAEVEGPLHGPQAPRVGASQPFISKKTYISCDDTSRKKVDPSVDPKKRGGGPRVPGWPNFSLPMRKKMVWII